MHTSLQLKLFQHFDGSPGTVSHCKNGCYETDSSPAAISESQTTQAVVSTSSVSSSQYTPSDTSESAPNTPPTTSPTWSAQTTRNSSSQIPSQTGPTGSESTSSSSATSLSKSGAASTTPFLFSQHSSPSLPLNFGPSHSPRNATRVVSPSSTTDQNSTTLEPQPPLPQQALVSSHASKAGPIAGGIIGCLLFLVALFLLWRYRNRLADRLNGKSRVAPSSEFLNTTAQVSNSRDGMLGGTRRQQRAMSMYSESNRVVVSGSYAQPEAEHSGGNADTFVHGHPLPFSLTDNRAHSERLREAVKRREQLYQAATSPTQHESQQNLVTTIGPSSHPSPPPLATSDTSHASYGLEIRDGDKNSSMGSHTRQESSATTQSLCRDPFEGGSDSEEDMQATSPMLSQNKASLSRLQLGDATADSITETNLTLAEEIGWAV